MIRAIAWVAATTIGLVAAGFLFHFPGSIAGEVDWSLGAGIFGLVLGAMSGGAVGVLQWASLQLPRRAGSRLVLAMALAVGSNHALFDASPFLVNRPLMAVVAGLVVALVFAWLPAEREPRLLAISAGAWAAGLLIAGLLGDAIGFPLEETPVGWATDHAFDGLIVGLAWGGATAATGIADRLRRGGSAETNRGLAPA